MTPEEYIGTNPYGNSSKMAKIVISEISYLPLATIKQTGNHILSMWMFSEADQIVTLCYGDKNVELNSTTSWQLFENRFEVYANDIVYLILPSGTYYIWHSKLERGNKPTDWTVAPEDVDASVDSKLEKYATLEITDDKISLAAASTKTYTDNAINDIEIGGRNLIIRSSETEETWINTSGDIEVHAKHSTCDYISITPGESYVFTKITSVIVTGDNGGYFRYAWYDSDKNYIGRAPNYNNMFIWIAPSDAYYIRISYPNDSMPKFERGNKATDWTPAPEDVEASVDIKLENYATLEVTDSKISTAVTSTKTYTDNSITNIEIGGRNLYLGTKDFSGNVWGRYNDSDSTIPSMYLIDDDYNDFTVFACNFTWSGYGQKLPATVVGETFTYSAWIKRATGYTGGISLYTTAYDGYSVTNPGSVICTECTEGEWVRVSRTFIVTSVPEDTNKQYLRIRAEANGYDGLSSETDVRFYICGIKVERGNKATDWTPAPEDIEVGAVATAKSYIDQTAEAITATVEGVDGRLTKMEQNADGFTWTIDETAIISTVTEYYKSTSPTELTGDSWSTSQPTWTEGTYIWMRTKNTTGNGVPSYTTPVCITDDIEVGGRNLIVLSSIINGYRLSQFGVYYSSTYSSLTAPINVDSGSKITYSVNSIHTAEDDTYWQLAFYTSEGEFISRPIMVEATTTEEKTYWTITVPDNAATARAAFPTSMKYNVKLEKGNKATDWTPAPEDVEAATEEAAKTATDFMKFDGGLTIGKLTDSTIGANVFIDSDSVYIRNGSEVLASYGEEIVLKHDGEEAFTIKTSEFLQSIIDAGRMFTGTLSSYSSGSVDYVQSTAISISADTYYALRVKYNDGHKDEYFIFKSNSYDSIYGWKWVSSSRSVLTLYLNSGKTSSFTVSCAYCDVNAVSELTIKGNVVIHNDSDTNGLVKSLPPLTVGIPSSTHLEIDGNEIASKIGEETTNHLYLNMEGGNVSVNNNCDRAIMFQDGAVYAKNKTTSITNIKNQWIGIIDAVNENGNTTFGYGNYLNDAGITHIYGSDVHLTAKGNITANSTLKMNNSSIQMSNGYGIHGTNSSGDIRHNIQPCNGSDNCVIGYGSYANSEGSTNVYGYNNINLYTSGNIVANSSFIVPNGSSFQGKNTSGTIRNNFQPCNTNNNCVIGYGSYSANEGSTNLYGEEVSILSNNNITIESSTGSINLNPGSSGYLYGASRALKVLWSGAYYMNASQYITLTEKVSKQLNGIVFTWSYYNDSTAQNYYWNHIFVPKQFVKNNSGNGTYMHLIGSTQGIKYIYITDTAVSGHANNASSITNSGITYSNTSFVLRAIFGV